MAAHGGYGGARPVFTGARPYRAITSRDAWRLAGILFIAGAISSLPVLFLSDHDNALWRHAGIPAALISGIACLIISRRAVPHSWLHAIPVFGMIEVAWAMVFLDPLFASLFFLVAVWAAISFPSIRDLWPHLILLGIAPFAYLFADDVSTREALSLSVSFAPALLLAAVVVARLTSALEASRLSYAELSSMDGLTGVGNYRALTTRLGEEIARHRRKQRQFALLVLDLDHFRSVNETQGHIVGDLMLTLVGSILKIEVRTEDMVFRQGGDEFSVVAPETNRDQAAELCARLERALSQISAGTTTLSATVAAAIYPHDGETMGELIDAADAALYERRRRERELLPGPRFQRT